MCNMWDTDLIGRPRVPDLLPELCDLPPDGPSKQAIREFAEQLWPESSLAPQRLWPHLVPSPDRPATPLGEEISASPPRSPTSPCYSPLERLQLGDDFQL